MTIYIVGGGVAGFAACIALRIQFPSTKIILLERSSKPRLCKSSNEKDESTNDSYSSSQGHGMILLPNAMNALQVLGAKEYILQSSRCIKTTRVTHDLGHADTTVVLEEHVDTPSDEMYCCTREALISSLSRTLFSNSHHTHKPLDNDMMTDILYDKKCVHVECSNDGRYVLQLSFSDKTHFDIDPKDLVVGADGVGSGLYRAMNPTALHRPLSRVFEVVTTTVSPSLAQQLGSCFHKIVLRDQGLAMGLLSPMDDVVIGFIQFDSERYPVPKTPLECRNLFLSSTSQVQSSDKHLYSLYCDQMNENSAHVWRPVNADLPDTMHLHNAILIGDAAHPLLPFTSQGVAAGLEDAIILSNCLRDHFQGLQTMDAVLSQFVSLRRMELQRIIDRGRDMLETFVHGNNKTIELPYVKLRDGNLLHQGFGLKAL